jgi:lipopolysaccharide export system permease protein
VNLLHRYIFKQVVAATAMAVVLFAFVLVLGNVMREVLDLLASGKLDLAMFGYLLLLLIPGVVPYALPLGLLTAVLLVVGRLCAQREYTAMRAAGLSLWSLAAPILLASCLGVVLCLFINFYYAPAADHAFKSALGNLARRNPVRLFQPGAYVRDFRQFVIHVGGRQGDVLEDVSLWHLDEQGRVVLWAHGRQGRVDYDAATDQLSLLLQDGEGLQYKTSDPEDMQGINVGAFVFKEHEGGIPSNEHEGRYQLSLSDLVGAPQSFSKLSLLTLGELLEKRDQPPPNVANPTPKDVARWRMDVQMQIQRDFAGAFSVLALGLLGLPLSLRIGRSENFINLALALGLALVYYFLLFSISLLRNHPEYRPDLLLWLPNFIFEALGVWLLYRAAQK